MIYKERMMSESDYKYNFRIYKMVDFLHKLRVIDNIELANHILVMEDARLVGLQLDYKYYRGFEGPGGSYYQF